MPQQIRGESTIGLSGRAFGLGTKSRGPKATPTVALAPPAATLSDSRAIWLTGGLSLTGGLLSGALNEIQAASQRTVNRVTARCPYTHFVRHAA